jgi:hypothetical protein
MLAGPLIDGWLPRVARAACSLSLVWGVACGSSPTAPAPAPGAPTARGATEDSVTLPAPLTSSPTSGSPAPQAARPSLDTKPLVRSAKPGKCGTLAGPLTVSRSLLADRLQLTAPAGAAASPRPWDIMDAPTVEAVETRLMIGGARSGGKGREEALAILATELFQLDPDLAKAEAGAIVQPTTFAEEAPKFLTAMYGASDIEAVAVSDPQIHAFAARPKQVELGERDAALVLALLLSLPDGTLQSVAFYVSPVLVKQAAGCTDLAERVASSLTVGRRQLERSAGVRELQRFGGGRRLVVTVPEGYVMVHQRAEDFDRYRLHKLRPLGLFPGVITVSVDPYPDKSLPPEATEAVAGRLLGQAITWKGQRTPRGGFLVVTEPLDPSKDPAKTGGPERYLQVLLQATREPKYLDEFRGVAETLELK